METRRLGLAIGRCQGRSVCLGEQGCVEEGTRDTGRRAEDTRGTRVPLVHWESLEDLQTSNPACPLRGHSRHPEDFRNQGIRVVHSRGPGAGPRLHVEPLRSPQNPPARSASLQSWQGKLPCLRGSPRGPLFHSLISQPPARSFLMPWHADTCTCTCTHMSEETCA